MCLEYCQSLSSKEAEEPTSQQVSHNLISSPEPRKPIGPRCPFPSLIHMPCQQAMARCPKVSKFLLDRCIQADRRAVCRRGSTPTRHTSHLSSSPDPSRARVISIRLTSHQLPSGKQSCNFGRLQRHSFKTGFHFGKRTRPSLADPCRRQTIRRSTTAEHGF